MGRGVSSMPPWHDGDRRGVGEKLERLGTMRASFIGRLESWKYQVHWAVLDMKDHGVPQCRERFYLVALLQPYPGKTFSFPAKLRAPDLGPFLDKAGAVPAAPVPQGHREAARLSHAYDMLRARRTDPATTPCIIDIRASPKVLTKWMVSCSPYLAAAVCAQGGHYISAYQRLMTVAEMCRLQCIPPKLFDYMRAGVSETAFLQAVGNAMNANVLARVLRRALHAAGLQRTLLGLRSGDFARALS